MWFYEHLFGLSLRCAILLLKEDLCSSATITGLIAPPDLISIRKSLNGCMEHLAVLTASKM